MCIRDRPNGIPGLVPAPAGYTTPGTPGSYEAGPAVYGTTYDPDTGDFIGPDGKTYNAGTGRDAPASSDSQGQSSTWQGLITSGMAG